jgi:glycine/D-amino acid oxidase-like deaminating enzyme/nitrite reductase/ring-hydroxylating ferredoxin subunit
VDVAVIGGGITGITAAYLLKQRGHKVALLERGRCGGFDSLNTTGHLTFVTDTRLHKLVKVFGKESAKKAWEAGQAAMAMVASNVKQEGISCEFRWVPGYLHAPTNNAPSEEIAALQDDAQIATGFGFPAEYQAAIPNFKTPGVQFNVAKFHIGKYLQALVRTIPRKGSFVFENTEASAVNKNPVKVKAGDHTIHCRYVILATHNPLMGNEKLISAALLQTKLSLYSSYAIGARIPKNLWPEACFWDTAEPYHYLRIDSHRGFDYAVFGGEDHKTGQEKDTPAVYQRLEKKLRHLIPAAQVDHHWSGQVIETIDGLPYIGPTGRNQFAATGFSGNGVTFGTLGAMMAVDAFERRKNPWASLFAIERKKYRGAAWNYVKENKDFPYHLIHDRLESAEGKSLRSLPSNHGKILKIKGRKTAAYRDPEGKLTLCSPVCTHLKCIVAWNDAEKTWDCPCHGSRFAPTGEVLSGPAEKPLEPFKESGS